MLDDEEQKYRNKALHLLKYRPRSVAEMRKRLRQSGAAESTVAAVIEMLQEHQLLDDHAFAEWLVNSRLNTKYRGKRYLRAELQHFGVERQICDEVLSQITSDEYVNTALELLQQKQHLWINQDHFNKKQKAYRLLASRGFTGEEISHAIDAWIEDK